MLLGTPQSPARTLRTLCAALVLGLSAGAATAETLRIATYEAGLTREGAGLLLRDLGREPDAATAGALAVIRETRPDILLLTGFDSDPGGRALAALARRLAEGPGGIDYPHRFTAPVNAGEPSGLDLDGDGMGMGRADAWGWGRFPGNGGMAVLSRLPFETGAFRSFTLLRWRDLPGAGMPVQPDGSPWPDEAAAAQLRLASKAHWDLPVRLPGGGTLHLLASNPTPPLFDGPEGANRLRNRDEIRFWAAYLAGTAFPDDQGRTAGPPEAPVIVLGNLNKDPRDGAGLPDGIAALLESDRLQDVRPASEGGRRAAAEQKGANTRHRTPPALDTADWRDDAGPGNLRVDYVLPDAALAVTGAGVFWPAPGAPLAEEAEAASAHRLVWVDVTLP